MKKVKFYFVFSLIVVFLSVIGILLGMVLVTIEQKHPEYLSAGIFKGNTRSVLPGVIWSKSMVPRLERDSAALSTDSFGPTKVMEGTDKLTSPGLEAIADGT